jgi:hypothetical protein
MPGRICPACCSLSTGLVRPQVELVTARGVLYATGIIFQVCDPRLRHGQDVAHGTGSVIKTMTQQPFPARSIG